MRSQAKKFHKLWKRLLSYRKSTWAFEDYPVETWKISNTQVGKQTFRAGLAGWHGLMGDGETEEQAIAELKRGFSSYKEKNSTLPRPGTYVPLKFASTEQIGKYRHIADDFFNKVLNKELGVGKPLFISDFSRLPTYEPHDKEQAGKQKEEVIRRTLSTYGVDITDVYDGPLYAVLELIQRTAGGKVTPKEPVHRTAIIRHPGWSPVVSAVGVAFFLALSLGEVVGSVLVLTDPSPGLPRQLGLIMLPGSAFFFYMAIVGMNLFRYRNSSIEVDETSESVRVNRLGTTTSYRYGELSYRATDWLQIISVFDKRTQRRVAIFDYRFRNAQPLVVWSRKNLSKHSSAF